MKTERLPIQRIEIQSRVLDDATGILERELRSLGADPAKVVRNLMGAELIVQWTKGLMSVETFRRSIRNLLVLNPGLRSER